MRPYAESCPKGSPPLSASAGSAPRPWSSSTGPRTVVFTSNCSTATTSRGSRSSEQGRPWSFDGDGALFRLVSEAHRIRLGAPLRSGARRPHIHGRAAAASDHGRLRGDAAAAAPAVPSGRRSGRRQDDHGRPAHQGADRAWRPAAVPRGLPGESRRAVAGRAVPALPPAVRDPDQRQARGGPHRQLVLRDQPGHRAAGQALTQRRCPGQARGA